jgi:hypothetical protein
MLAYTLANDKTSLRKLLVRNGISVPSDATDKELTTAILIASSKSNVFKAELAALLSSKIDQVNSEYSSFVGGQFDIGTQEDQTMFTGSQNFFNATGKPASLGIQNLKKDILNTQKKDKTKKPKTPKQPREPREPRERKGLFSGLFSRNEDEDEKDYDSEPKQKGRVWSWLGENVFTKENINNGINMGLTALNNKIQEKRNQVDIESSLIAEKQDEIINDKGKASGISIGTIVLIIGGVALVGGMIYYFTKK